MLTRPSATTGEAASVAHAAALPRSCAADVLAAVHAAAVPMEAMMPAVVEEASTAASTAEKSNGRVARVVIVSVRIRIAISIAVVVVVIVARVGRDRAAGQNCRRAEC